MTNNRVCLLIIFRSALFINHWIVHVLASLECSSPWKGFCMEGPSLHEAQAGHTTSSSSVTIPQRCSTMTHTVWGQDSVYTLAQTTMVTKSIDYGGQCTLSTHAIHTGHRPLCSNYFRLLLRRRWSANHSYENHLNSNSTNTLPVLQKRWKYSASDEKTLKRIRKIGPSARYSASILSLKEVALCVEVPLPLQIEHI